MPDKKYLINNPDKIKLNEQNEVDTILGNPPSWILHWGITLILFAVFLFGLLSWWIKYPDIIPARVEFLTESPVIPIQSKTTGKINELFVQDNQLVKEGSLLAVIDSKASKDDILVLENFLKELDQSKTYSSKFIPKNSLNLGDLQVNYTNLCKKIEDYEYHINNVIVKEKTTSIDAQIKELENQIKLQSNKHDNLFENLKLAQKDQERKKQLFDEGVISEQEFEKANRELFLLNEDINNLQNQINLQISNINLNMEQLRFEARELNSDRQKNSYDKKITLHEIVEKLKSQIDGWKKNHFLMANIDGKISMSKIWSVQQTVTANEEVFSIVPDQGRGRVIARALLPRKNSGKVFPKQTANLKMDGFSFLEYGIIKAKVNSIALVPKNDFYQLEINLPDTLVTTYDSIIPFRQGMQGDVEIITQDRRVIERIFDKIFSILKNR